MKFSPSLPTIVEEDENAPPAPVHCIYCCNVCKRARTCKAVLREQAKARLKAKAKAKARARARARVKTKPKIKVTVSTSTITIPKASTGEICGQIWPDGNGHFTMKLWDNVVRPNISSKVWFFKGLSPYEITLFEMIHPNGLPDFTDEDRKKLNADCMGWEVVYASQEEEFTDHELAGSTTSSMPFWSARIWNSSKMKLPVSTSSKSTELSAYSCMTTWKTIVSAMSNVTSAVRSVADQDQGEIVLKRVPNGQASGS